MLSILLITVPIYAAVAAGCLATRFGMFQPADMRVLGMFVINIAVPCLLFGSIATRPFAEIANPTYLAAYGLGSLVAIGGGLFYARKLERLPAMGRRSRPWG